MDRSRKRHTLEETYAISELGIERAIADGGQQRVEQPFRGPTLESVAERRNPVGRHQSADGRASALDGFSDRNARRRVSGDQPPHQRRHRRHRIAFRSSGGVAPFRPPTPLTPQHDSCRF